MKVLEIHRNPSQTPLPGGFHVQLIEHVPEYGAGFALYITLSLMIRAVAVIAGLLVATVVASQLAVFLEVDSCLDAGGIYVRATGACSAPASVEYVAQFARPDLYVLWSIFLVLTGLPFWLTYKATAVLAAWFAGQTARKLGRNEG